MKCTTSMAFATPRTLNTLRSANILRPAPVHYQGTCRRAYYSYEHEAPPPTPAAENAILSAALTHVPIHGFTTTALSYGARDAGYLDVSVNLFPTGAFALVNHHLVTQRLALAKSCSTTDPPTSIGAEVRRLVWTRLQGNVPIIRRWQEAISLLALPTHVPTSLHELALLSDEILFRAGDASVDASWYTKRAALSAIYVSSELFMTQDDSTGFVETEEFLNRRLAEAEKARDAVGMVGTWVGMQGIGFVNILRSKGVSI